MSDPTISILTRYAQQGASSRVRFYAYEKYLVELGLRPEFFPFLHDQYLSDLYVSGRRKGFISAIVKRLAVTKKLSNSGPVWVEHEVCPWLPAAIEELVCLPLPPIVSDFDDAIFHRYALHGNPMVRRLLRDKIARVMNRSAIVMAGNSYLADYALKSGAEKVEIVPTVVDTARYSRRTSLNSGVSNCIGWIGTPSTWKEYCEPLSDIVCDVTKSFDGKFRVVGAGSVSNNADEIENLDWSLDAEVDQILGMDIGIMPLNDSPWARGKCGYKLLQYMACGLPVVASPVGVNTEIVQHGINGFLAETREEWRRYLVELIIDPSLRKSMGEEGVRLVANNYSLEKWGPAVGELLRSVI